MHQSHFEKEAGHHRRAAGGFCQRRQERGVAHDIAEEIFDLIEHFGGYGFNKSHTAAYGQIGYQTAYLKANYTPEFMAALLSSEIDDGNKRDVFVDHIADAKRLGVVVRPPNVNEGEPDFTVRDGEVTFGLTAIKGLGRGAAEALLQARTEKGPFRDLFDLCERVDSKTVTKLALERLIKAGACDEFGKRSALMAALPKAIQSAGELQLDRRRGQTNMFDIIEVNGDGIEALPDVPEWPDNERLKYEKEALDFFLSSHPLAACEAEIKRFATHQVEQLRLDGPRPGGARRGNALANPLHEHEASGSQRPFALCPLQTGGFHRRRRMHDVAGRVRPL